MMEKQKNTQVAEHHRSCFLTFLFLLRNKLFQRDILFSVSKLNCTCKSYLFCLVNCLNFMWLFTQLFVK